MMRLLCESPLSGQETMKRPETSGQILCVLTYFCKVNYRY